MHFLWLILRDVIIEEWKIHRLCRHLFVYLLYKGKKRCKFLKYSIFIYSIWVSIKIWISFFSKTIIIFYFSWLFSYTFWMGTNKKTFTFESCYFHFQKQRLYFLFYIFIRILIFCSEHLYTLYQSKILIKLSLLWFSIATGLIRN